MVTRFLFKNNPLEIYGKIPMSISGEGYNLNFREAKFEHFQGTPAADRHDSPDGNNAAAGRLLEG
jgi:hypothetical protein